MRGACFDRRRVVLMVLFDAGTDANLRAASGGLYDQRLRPVAQSVCVKGPCGPMHPTLSGAMDNQWKG